MVDSCPENTGSCQVQGELYNIAGIGTDDAPADVQLTGDDTTIALDAFFDFDKHDDAERLATDPTVTSKEMVDDEFRQYLTAKSTNWRVNNVMD